VASDRFSASVVPEAIDRSVSPRAAEEVATYRSALRGWKASEQLAPKVGYDKAMPVRENHDPRMSRKNSSALA
jgi:hypothetical protein